MAAQAVLLKNRGNVTSKIDSRTILGEQGAEQLLGQGDMLHMAGGGRLRRVHGAFVSDADSLGAQHCPRMPGAIRNHFGRWGYEHVFLAGNYKHRYDHGFDAGSWCAFAVCQLRGIICFNHRDRNRFVDECQHAAVYA